MKILYEDNHLLVVDKPINVPVQADASRDDDLLTLLKAYVKEKYNKPGDVYLGLVHRLDRPVGGVMVFARTSKAAARLASQFKSGRAKKRYIAIVEGEAKPDDVLVDWLKKDEITFSSSVVTEQDKGAKLARLAYRRLAQSGNTSLLDVELYTGRPHQIRVQLAHAGLPIQNDQRYNAKAEIGAQIRLWAYALTLTHPTLNEPMTFFSVPDWEEYPTQLKYLPAFSVCNAVYEDEELLVVDKNRGVEVTEGLYYELLSITEPLYPVHRLDANTEGLVAFAKTERMKDLLEEDFYEHRAEKLYLAIVADGGLPDEGRLLHFAKKDGEGMRLCDKGEAGAQRMELFYRVVARKEGLCKVRIRLITGRTHQIRLQFMAIGHPVLGDDRYGDHELNRLHKKRTQQLLAKRLTLQNRTFESNKEPEL
ncbi:MAG: RNA pseudouridine synthase [Clostridia bacterium]|nr:RNA pseudouridine synthase [Clostridia bacterium]